MPRRVHLEGTAAECRCAPCSVIRIAISPMVLFVIGLVVLSYIPLVVWRKHTGGVLDVAHLVFFHAMLVMLLMSYFMTLCVDPGTPPDWWVQQQLESGNPEQYRRCAKSDKLKPPRAHFCSVTQRLVLNMDHFCPWVDNTVGYYNRKFFILFLVYSCITCLYAAGMLYFEGALDVRAQRSEGFAPATTRLMAMMVDGALGVALIFFAFFHLNMAAKNETTIESFGYADPRYDLGAEANLEQVFGRNKLMWLLPVYGDGPCGDGMHWPMRELRPAEDDPSRLNPSVLAGDALSDDTDGSS